MFFAPNEGTALTPTLTLATFLTHPSRGDHVFHQLITLPEKKTFNINHDTILLHCKKGKKNTLCELIITHK